MLKKWIFTCALSALVTTTAIAAELSECSLSNSSYGGMLFLQDCKLTAMHIDKISEHFEHNLHAYYFSLDTVEMSAEVSSKLEIMLGANTQITHIQLRNTDLGLTALEHLADNKNITDLTLIANKLDDKALANLAHNDHLQYLHLDEERVTNKAILSFINTNSLVSLSLANKQFSEEEMNELVSQLASQPKFIDLSLNNITGASLEPLKNLNQLAGLRIFNININSKDAAAISTLTNLQLLFLVSTKLAAKDTVNFKQLKKLKILYIDSKTSHPSLGDKGIKFIKYLPKLDSLSLSSQEITDQGAKFLSQYSNITSMYLEDNLIGDRGAISLSKNKRIRTLELSTNRISDEGAMAFVNHPSLRGLYLSSNFIGDTGAVALANQSNLYAISLSNNPDLTDTTAFAFASRSTYLQALYVINNNFSPAAVEALRSNPNIDNVFLQEEDTNYFKRADSRSLYKYKVKSSA